ncbi:hypothetical protein BGW36DRAFT_289225 [Talaromyces proteolyticus]|uniref:Myb-like domain-containing protein n=1 Tax=Talaromyces proteolyticus TaxID=1131652 RepID=A0AAD4KXZ3_9EURO|nr:uncharacterized protein BGW36DRAFT_289225 [Talaromyces proteolyticus]KAH8702594.1 hypothetical protein BGW36DRAFT_289225 [Talaromyces proteolyticus]
MPDQIDRDWTEEEKYGLLTVILRNAGVPPSSLFEVFRQYNVKPPWDDMALPPGRTLNECKQQFTAMWQTSQSQLHARPTESWQVPPPPAVFPAFNHPTPVNPALSNDPYTSRKRPLYSTERPAIPRAIQPRPPHSIGQFNSEAGSPGPGSPGWADYTPGKGSEPPRKRGRPNKAEAERRKAEAEARGESYPPPRRRSSKTKNPATPSGGASATSDSSMVSPMHVAHTPELQKQERILDTLVSKDLPEQNTQLGIEASDAPDTDPVKGIIRSQTSQDRRLPLPHEFPARRESFSTRKSPHESLIPQTRTLDHPFDASPKPQTDEKITHPPTDHIIQQAKSGPQVHPSGGYITAITHPGETKT